MHLPGLPTTKARVIARAASEGWPFEEQKGIGGTRRMYELPAKYWPTQGTSVAAPMVAKVIGTIAAGSAKVDTVKLELAIRALSEWESERGVHVSDERRPAVIAVLYEYLQNHEEDGEQAMSVVLRALG